MPRIPIAMRIAVTMTTAPSLPMSFYDIPNLICCDQKCNV